MQRASSNLLRPRREQKGGGRGELALLAWAGTSICCPWALALLVLRPLDSDRNLHHWLPWFLSLNLDGLIPPPSWVSSLQMAKHGTSQFPQLCEPISIMNLLSHLSSYVLLVLFLWRTLTPQGSSGSGVMQALPNPGSTLYLIYLIWRMGAQ